MKPSKVEVTKMVSEGPGKYKAIGNFTNSILGRPTRESLKINPDHLPSSASTSASAIEQSTSASASTVPSASTSSQLPGHSVLKKHSTKSRGSTTKRRSIVIDPAATTTEKNNAHPDNASEQSARKSVTISAPASAASSDHTLHSTRPRSTSLTSEHSDHQKSARAKSIVVIGTTPVAVFMESESDVEAGGTAAALTPVITPSTEKKPSETPEANEPPPEAKPSGPPKGRRQRGLRTFRIWNPSQDRKSILVQVGDEEGQDEAEKIFETSQIRHKSYTEWHKQAKSRLPSISGGSPIENVADVIKNAPALQKEEDPRTLQKSIKRLSIDNTNTEAETSAGGARASHLVPLEKRKSPLKELAVQVDYTRVREIIPWKEREKGGEGTETPPEAMVTAAVEHIKEEDYRDDKQKHAPTTPVPVPVTPVPVPATPVPVPATPVAVEWAHLPTPVTSPVAVVPEQEEKSSSSSESCMVIEVSDDHEERLLEEERKQAGIDFKEKVRTLRELAEHLTDKRVIRHELVQNATGFVQLDTEQIPIKEHILYLLEDIGSGIHDFASFFVIWEKEIREINGRFGVVISSYFIWLRQMVAMEIFFFTVSNAFIIIPQIVEDIQDPPAEHPELRRKFHLSNLITGEGYFHHSYLYYTGYHNRNELESNPFLNPAFRFLFCILFMFFVLTYFIFSRLTNYYQSIRMESKVSGVAHMEHFKSIICGWDCSCSDPQAKVYLHKIIRREMYMLARASEHRPGAAIVQMEMRNKKFLAMAVKKFGLFWGPWVVHIVGNVLILLACVVLGLILVYLCQLKLYYYLECVTLRDELGFEKHLHHRIMCPHGSQFLNTWILSMPALFASMTTLLLTKFIVMVGDNESWNTPERKIHATMIRAGLFNFTNIGVFYSFWISHKPRLKKEGFSAETVFGKELYRLVVIQGLVDVVLNFGVKGIYHLMRRRKKGYKMTEFRTEYCSLSMFFIHAVSRIGTLFCPPISIFVTLRLILDFYQNRFALLHLSAKETFNSHASQVYAPFLLTFFILCYLITSFMNVYYVAETKPSDFNGPFMVYNESYDQVLGRLLESENSISWLSNLAHPGFLITLNCILAALVFFCREWGRTYEPIIENLNEQISLERADRDLLLKAIFEIGQVTADKVARNSIADASKSRKSAILKAISTIIPEPADADESPDDAEKGDKKGASKQGSGKVDGGRLDDSPVKKTESGKKSDHRVSVAPVDNAEDAMEQQVDDQITQLIHQVRGRRRTVEFRPTPQVKQVPRQSAEQQAQQQRFSISNEVNEALRRELLEKQKTMKAQDEKAMQNRVDNMNTILGSIVEKRRQMARGAGAAVSAATTRQQTAQAKPAKVLPPPTIEQQLSQLNIAKMGAAGSPVNQAKGRQSIMQAASTAAGRTASRKPPVKMKR